MVSKLVRLRLTLVPLFLLAALAIAAHAGIITAPATPFVREDCRFHWQPVTAPDMKAYRLYVSQTSGQYDPETSHVIPLTQTHVIGDVTWVTTTCSAAGITTDQTFYAVVTAVDQAGNESAYSNEVSSTRDTTPPGTVILELEIFVTPEGGFGVRERTP
jgi:hypothetical protein